MRARASHSPSGLQGRAKLFQPGYIGCPAGAQRTIALNTTDDEGEQPIDHQDPGPVRAWLIDTRTAISFFTRLPVPTVLPGTTDHSAPDFSRAARAVPLAGLVIGLLSGMVLFLAAFSGLSALAAALLAVLAATILTGGLHEDGLADTADGLGAFGRERRLEIMRDSRIGTFGVIALIGTYGLKTVLLAQLIDGEGPLMAGCALMAAEATSRIAALMPLHHLAPARGDGLSHASGRPQGSAMIQGWGVAAAITAVLVGLTVGWVPGLVGFLLCLGGGLAVTRLAAHMLGGHTGDIAGAAQQLSLLAMLAGMAALAAS
jgi:adenosylcobinamide-GDP ribazoletransferase